MMKGRGEQLMVHDALRRESEAWVVLMLSGAATHADADALRRWRARSPAHECAFRDASRLQKLVRSAAAELRAEEAWGLPNLTYGLSRSPSARFNRRAVMTGAIAASAAGVALFAGGSAFNLLPGHSHADFVTAKGETRTFALGDGVSAELNTLTRMARRPDIGSHGVELLDGEVLLTAALESSTAPLVALAGNGRASAHWARFSLRCDGADVTVTCLAGAVMVEAGGRRREVTPGHQLAYGDAGLGALVAINPAVVTAWRRGALVFQREPLRNVVAEINRYRPGRIVLGAGRLGDREVTGIFYVAQIDEIFEQVRSAFGARVTHLPGDIVVLT